MCANPCMMCEPARDGTECSGDSKQCFCHLTGGEIVDAFEGCAHDLLEACRLSGDKQERIHLNDATDAAFHQLEMRYHAEYSHDLFVKIEKALKNHYRLGRKKYIYF